MSDQAVTAKAQTKLGSPLGLDLIPEGAVIALAISGGGDSVALLHAVSRWAKPHRAKPHVFTVDHSLRPESADEAQFVSEICKRLQLPHSTLVWQVPKATQNAARQARHTLLAKAAREIGAAFILLGHTLDDVSETLAMRRSRKTPKHKQAGPLPVSVSPVWPDGRGLTLLRPLLLTSRRSLRDWLSEQELAWIDDPSNENDDYERARIRKMLDNGKALEASETLRALQVRTRAEAPLAEVLLACADCCDAYGVIRVPLPIDQDLFTDLLSIIIPAASGTARIPKAYARLNAMSDMLGPEATRYTIGGAWLQRAEHDILIGREPVQRSLKIEDNVFDGRFIRDETARFPDQRPPFLVRHALPDRQGWRSLIPDRLKLHASIIAANHSLLTKPHEVFPF
ncbi:MAG: tRNA lysidine(34) synthetase TilS [Pseudomonadota bacterium]